MFLDGCNVLGIHIVAAYIILEIIINNLSEIEHVKTLIMGCLEIRENVNPIRFRSKALQATLLLIFP